MRCLEEEGHLVQGQDQVGGLTVTCAPQGTHGRMVGHLGLVGEHVARDTDTWEGHIAGRAEGYKYQFLIGRAISPEPILYVATPEPIPVNFAKIVHTSWISVYDLLL